MTKKSLLGKLSLIALMAIASQGCKKENGIDNNNVIQRPYVLYAADKNGTIYNTNDGVNYKTILPGDGSPLRGLITSKANIIIVKSDRVFLSTNGGKAFNPLKDAIVTVPTNIKWANFIIDVPALNRIYVSNLIAGTGQVAYSPENGTYFNADTNWSATDTPFATESFTYLDNQTLYGFSISGSVYGASKLFFKSGKDISWKPRPTNLPDPANFYLAHIGNTLVATDYDGVKGAYYSDDEGKTFKAYSGLPANKILYATYSAYDKLLIGTQGMGVYVADGTTFKPSNSGIDANTTVYSIVGKDNLYKNNVSKKFFYIATSTGIYKSEDLAKSWVKVKKDGDYRLVY